SFATASLMRITSRVLLLPFPGVFDHIGQVKPATPAQLFTGLTGIGKAGGNITWTSRRNLRGYVFTGNLSEFFNNFQYRKALAGAEIENMDTGFTPALMFEGFQMAVGQIHDMDLISHA